MIHAVKWWYRKSNDEINDIIDHMEETCVLDIADKGRLTLQEVGDILGVTVTRERVRQLEEKALRKARHPKRCKKLREYWAGWEGA